MTTEIGVRDFRQNLRRWLDAVEGGEEIVVTERGKPVARVVPVKTRSRWDELVEAGAITPPSRPWQGRSRPRVRVHGSMSAYVEEQRG